MVEFSTLEKAQAKTYLDQLIHIYQQGLLEPQPLLPNLAYQHIKKPDEAKIVKLFQQPIRNQRYIQQDNLSDRNIGILWDDFETIKDRFNALAENVFNPYLTTPKTIMKIEPKKNRLLFD